MPFSKKSQFIKEKETFQLKRRLIYYKSCLFFFASFKYRSSVFVTKVLKSVRELKIFESQKFVRICLQF